MMQLRRSGETGFSLIELLVAMIIGLILVAGVMQVFLGNRQAQRTEQSVSHIEENGRIAMGMLVQDLREAGYHGCSNKIALEKQMDPSNSRPIFTVRSSDLNFPVSSDFGVGSVVGYEKDVSSGVWSPALPTSLSSSLTGMRSGSDMLVAYFGEPTQLVISGNIYGSMDITATLNGESISTGSHLIIDNCQLGDLFTVTNTPTGSPATIKHGTASNSSDSLMGNSSHYYDSGSTVSRFVAHVYYVRDSGRKTPAKETIYSLYRWDSSGAPYELVEGVEYMRVLYGENMSADPSTINVRYVSAGNVTNWSNVRSVQIALLAQSADSLPTDATDKTAYTFVDRSISATGTYQYASKHSLHRVYTATIELRNRVE